MKTKKQISLLLAAVMLISIFAGIFATPSKPTFSDVPADHWAYASVNRASENGWRRLPRRAGSPVLATAVSA